MQKQARITSKWQITVPREVRRILAVQVGDLLLFENDSKSVRVRPARNQSAFSKYRAIGNPEIKSGRKSISRWLRKMRGQ
jgi:bifunctional DNA-binding transcriptional regulator/antitoxin component of YhaV-PrlF toxin-antitoxin module